MLTHMCHMKKIIHPSLHLVEQLLLTEIKLFLADKVMILLTIYLYLSENANAKTSCYRRGQITARKYNKPPPNYIMKGLF